MFQYVMDIPACAFIICHRERIIATDRTNVPHVIYTVKAFIDVPVSISRSLLESHIALRIKYHYEDQARVYRINLRDKNTIGRRRWNITTQEPKIRDVKIEIVMTVINGSMKLTVPPDRKD